MAAHRIRRLVAVGGVVLGGLAVTGCGSADVEGAPVERKAFAFSGETLSIDSDDSELVLMPADVKDVQVSRQVDGWVVMGNGPEPSWKLEDGRLTLRVECDALASNCSSRHEVRIPRGVAVTVEDDNGAVTADGFATALKVRSDNGRVTVRGAGGPLDLQSDNGEIRVEGATSRSVVARSDNGRVHLGLGVVPDRVETVSDNGAITIELPAGKTAYAVEARSNNGEVEVGVPTDDGSAHVVKARSDNGEVTVRSAN
ncbi:DUF4097 family beta strand repeat-containing protein [Streptomyces sp. SP18CS02]|uniref:DUF4097 family beta strand repeat-containing protein n=1 Tax=Streptomyces sp. SP18CS02 TaxID=3002531 RepID=UPI002E77626E|nr:DUF4097 family beta strand repeat-containing protein [Streptomyces sp. SP18CS02]MEE1753299.1 DUF4097 family beta strand repeat-containing protein [Streptomyces sp. SP18CS02]